MNSTLSFLSETMDQLRLPIVSQTESDADRYLDSIIRFINATPMTLWTDDVAMVYHDHVIQKSSTVNTTKRIETLNIEPDDISKFVSTIDIDCLDVGYVSKAERYIEELCAEKGEQYILKLMNDVYTQNPQNELILCAVINILSHIDYEKLGSVAITLCVGMIAVGTPLVWEYVINACDQWGKKEFIPCLQSIQTDSILLKRMLKKVIDRLQKEEDEPLCLSEVYQT